MKQQFVLVMLLLGLFLTSCGQKAQTSSQTGPGAVVTLRDGTKIEGAVADTSPTEIKIAGNDGIARTIPMTQVKSIEYSDANANRTQTAEAPVPPAPPSPPVTNTSNNRPPAPKPASPPPAPNTRVEPSGVVETHEHPVEAQITTKTYELPSGTNIAVRTEETIDSAKAVEGQTFVAEVTEDVRDDSGATVIPRGANASIYIISASKGGRFRGASDLQLDLKSVAIEGRQYELSTSDVVQTGKSGIGVNKRTGIYTGGGAAVGAIIGAIAGGGKGAAIGAGAGAGAGALTQVLTKGSSIRVPVESILTFQLDMPLHVVAAR